MMKDSYRRNVWKEKLKANNLLLQKVSPLTERDDMFQMSLDESNMSSVVERQLRWWFCRDQHVSAPPADSIPPPPLLLQVDRYSSEFIRGLELNL